MADESAIDARVTAATGDLAGSERTVRPSVPATPSETPACGDEAMLCERCGQAAMYRMHAVWRCPACGFKTDCCGW